jgi:hypothetical protein
MITYRLQKVIKAPIKYVYDWLTDFTDQDNSIWGGKYPRIILFKSKKKTVYASYKAGADNTPKLAVRIVTMVPSKYRWHLDYYAEEDIETADYKLSKTRNNWTRLSIQFKNSWKHGKGPSAQSLEKQTGFIWDKYSDALESDYRSGKKAN